METTNPKTYRDFIPGKFAFCKFVDYVENKPEHHLLNKKGDFFVQILDDGMNGNGDFYINSSEIWQYVNCRFHQLIDEIHHTMQTRIDATKNKLVKTKITELSESYNLKVIRKLINDAHKRQSPYYYDLQQYQFYFKNSGFLNQFPKLKTILDDWMWEGVSEIRSQVQLLKYDWDMEYTSRINNLMSSIGCDSNQTSNLHYLNYYSPYEDSSDNSLDFVELNWDNSMTPAERSNFYNNIINNPKIKDDKQKAVDFVTECYVWDRNLLHEEIARIYFVAVLPDFVQKYQLLPFLINWTGDELLYLLLACALDYKSQMNEDEDY